MNRWWQRYKKEGHVNPRMNLGRKAKIDKAELKKYVDAHPDSRLYDISLKFMVSVNAIHRSLKKLGYSYKKKPSPMWKQAKKNEPNTRD